MNLLISVYKKLSIPQKLLLPSLIVFVLFFIFFSFSITHIGDAKQNTSQLKKQLMPNYELIIYNQILLERIAFNLNNAVVSNEKNLLEDTQHLMDEFEEKMHMIDQPQFIEVRNLILVRFNKYKKESLRLSNKLIDEDFNSDTLHQETKMIIEDYNFMIHNLENLKSILRQEMQNNTKYIFETLDFIVLLSVVLFFIYFIFFLFVTKFTYKNLKEKIDEIISNFHEITTSEINFKKRIEYHNEDEFANLSHSFNAYIDQLEHQHNEVLETKNDIKNFIADTVHQISSPITAIGINLKLIQMKLKDTKDFESFDNLFKQLHASVSMLSNSYEDLAYLTSNDFIQYKPSVVDLSEIVQNRIKFFNPLAIVNGKSIDASIDLSLFCFINPIELERLIDNNITNGIKYASLNTVITIRLTKNDKMAILEFITTGKEIIDKNKIFEKNYRIDTNLKGLGWGLHMVKNICIKNDINYNVSFVEKQNKFTYMIKLTEKKEVIK